MENFKEQVKTIMWAADEDGFTHAIWVDTETGTWGSGELKVLRVTHDQSERFDQMSDSERIEYANRHGKVLF